MKPIYTKNRTIGLLGGSFNPAHGGHVHISLYALKKLHLDAVWWLVSPQNPLKSEEGMAKYTQRISKARQMAAPYPRIIVSDIEARHGLRFSYQTVALLKQRYPGTHFVWLMGADNPADFHRWRRWQQLLLSLPVVVFDRAPYSHTALRSKSAQFSRRFMMKSNDIANFTNIPSFSYIHMKRDPISATALRKTLGKKAFLLHT